MAFPHFGADRRPDHIHTLGRPLPAKRGFLSIMENIFAVRGNIVDVVNARIFKGEICIKNGVTTSVTEKIVSENHYILPGLIDAHVHIESSMLIPSEFARLAFIQGTTATISDPHEIANVLGMKGVMFMVDNGKKTPFKFNFGAPSCVPATPFESAGAALGPAEIDQLLAMPEISYLAEMMNVPGVLHGDQEVASKLASAKKYGKPVDGHAPGISGKDAEKYIRSGISTDHECATLEEAKEKANLGMNILIREGSAAKNFDDLIDLIDTHPDQVMLCSDDKHPDDLLNGHINALIKRGIAKGKDPIRMIRAATVNPILHYKIKSGLIRVGDPADFIVVDDLKKFTVLKTFVDGILVAENGKCLISRAKETPLNIFNAREISVVDLEVKAESEKIRTIGVTDGQLYTKAIIDNANIVGGKIVSDTRKDVLKLVVVNRYASEKPAIAFIHHMGIKKGAIASSVAHDSHNIIATGADDQDIVNAINLLIENKGGIVYVNGTEKLVLPLAVAGIMSADDGFEVAKLYSTINNKALSTGTDLKSPYMTLSFMALLVIPELKLSDKGLFDSLTFSFTTVCIS